MPSVVIYCRSVPSVPPSVLLRWYTHAAAAVHAEYKNDFSSRYWNIWRISWHSLGGCRCFWQSRNTERVKGAKVMMEGNVITRASCSMHSILWQNSNEREKEKRNGLRKYCLASRRWQMTTRTFPSVVVFFFCLGEAVKTCRPSLLESRAISGKQTNKNSPTIPDKLWEQAARKNLLLLLCSLY